MYKVKYAICFAVFGCIVCSVHHEAQAQNPLLDAFNEAIEERAYELADSLSDELLAKGQLQDSIYFYVLYKKSLALANTAKRSKAVKYLFKSISVADKYLQGETLNHYRGNLHMDAGRVLYYQAKMDSAATSMKKGGEFFLKANEPKNYAKCQINLVYIYNDIGKTEKAYQALRESQRATGDSADASTRMRLSYALSAQFSKMNQYDSAIYHVQQAMNLAREIGDSSSMGLYSGTLAHFLVNTKRFKQAVDAAWKSIYLKGQNLQVAQFSHRYGALGRAHEGLGQIDSAIVAYKKANAEAPSERNKANKSATLTNLGSIYITDEQPDSAIHYYLKAIEYKKSLNLSLGLVPCYLGLANASLKLNQLAKAKHYLDSANTYLQQYNNFRYFVTYHELHGYWYFKKGEYDKGIAEMKLREHYTDSLLSEEREARIDGLRTLYETQQKELEIANLSKENALKALEVENGSLIIKKREQQVLAAIVALVLMLLVLFIIWRSYRLKQKLMVKLQEQNQLISIHNGQLEKLNKEIYHRTKNNFQTMRSLLNLQKYQIDDKNAREIIAENENRMHAMGLVFNKLLSGEKNNGIQIDKMIPELVDDLSYSYRRNVVCDFTLAHDELNTRESVPVGLALNEALSNAFKYGITSDKEGKLQVTYRVSNGFKELVIQDNGSGFPIGFDPHSQQSFGVELMMSMMEQLEGEVAFKNDEGAKVLMRWPVHD